MNLRQLPVPARAIATTVPDAVAAARSTDVVAFREAVARLAALDQAQVGLVLGAVVRLLLEELHPDGLTGDDVQAVLERCARAAPGADRDVLATLLTGALGIHEPAGEPRPLGAVEAAGHAPLLIAELLAGRAFAGYLESAFAEIARAETVEAP